MLVQTARSPRTQQNARNARNARGARNARNARAHVFMHHYATARRYAGEADEQPWHLREQHAYIDHHIRTHPSDYNLEKFIGGDVLATSGGDAHASPEPPVSAPEGAAAAAAAAVVSAGSSAGAVEDTNMCNAINSVRECVRASPSLHALVSLNNTNPRRS